MTDEEVVVVWYLDHQATPITSGNAKIKIREVYKTIMLNYRLEAVNESFSRIISACALNLGGHFEHNL